MKAMVRTESTAVIAFDDNLIQSFIDFVDSGSPQTIKTYIFCLKKFYRYLLNNNIKQPMRDDIKNYRDELETTLRPASVKLNLNAVKMFFAWLSSEGLYPNIGVGIKKHAKDETPEFQTYKRAALTAKEVAKVLNAMPKDKSVSSLRNRCLLTLLVCTGIRRCEAARLNKNSVKRQGGKFYIEFIGKGNKLGKVILPQQCYDLIQEYFKARGTVKATDPLFISLSSKNYGKRLGVDAVGRIAKAALTNAGFDGAEFSCHSCRHAWASIAFDIAENDIATGRKSNNEKSDVVTMKLIQINLRHSSQKTTEIYLHTRNLFNNPATSRVADTIFKEMIINAA